MSTGRPSSGEFRGENAQSPSGSEQYTSTRRRSRLVSTFADDSRDPHHGHTGNCSTPPSTRSEPRDSVICRSASSKEFGDTDDPTQSPIRNGVVPHRESPASTRSRRSISHAHTSAEARWNCCAVSSRSVYRISTATPRVPS